MSVLLVLLGLCLFGFPIITYIGITMLESLLGFTVPITAVAVFMAVAMVVQLHTVSDLEENPDYSIAVTLAMVAICCFLEGDFLGFLLLYIVLFLLIVGLFQILKYIVSPLKDESIRRVVIFSCFVFCVSFFTSTIVIDGMNNSPSSVAEYDYDGNEDQDKNEDLDVDEEEATYDYNSRLSNNSDSVQNYQADSYQAEPELESRFYLKSEIEGLEVSNNYVYVTEYGECYHTLECPTIRNSTYVKPYFLGQTPYDYRECSVCNPYQYE